MADRGGGRYRAGAGEPLTAGALTRPRRVLLIAATFVATGLAWVWMLAREHSVAPSPTTFVATWTVMMAAMMLPSLLPSLLLFTTVTRSREQHGHRPVPSGVFLAGYLGAWAMLGVLVALGGRVVPDGADVRRFAVAAGLLLGGAYQLTRLKAWCLGHCRSPMQFFTQHWHDGVVGALRLGAHHGLYCVGCCWGLMAGLIALGMMQPAWMGLMALVILGEKVLPAGPRLAVVVGGLLLAAGLAVLLGALPVSGPSMGGMHG